MVIRVKGGRGRVYCGHKVRVNDYYYIEVKKGVFKARCRECMPKVMGWIKDMTPAELRDFR